MQVPATSPVTQGLPGAGSPGSGFGQNGSTTYRGTKEFFAFNWLNGFHTPSPTTRVSTRVPTYIHRQTLIAISFAGLDARNGLEPDADTENPLPQPRAS